MFDKRLKRYIPYKDPVSAADLNAIQLRLAALENMLAIPPLNINNSAGKLEISLIRQIPVIIRFELAANLDYYGVADAKIIVYNKQTATFQQHSVAAIDDCKVRDSQGIFAGQGPSGNRSGDRGFAIGLGTGVNYEVISLQGSAKFIHFRCQEAFTQNDSTVDVQINNYYGGRHPLNDDVSSSGVGDITVYNPPARSSPYTFSGLNEQNGLAIWDEIQRRYWIWNIEC